MTYCPSDLGLDTILVPKCMCSDWRKQREDGGLEEGQVQDIKLSSFKPLSSLNTSTYWSNLQVTTAIPEATIHFLRRFGSSVTECPAGILLPPSLLLSPMYFKNLFHNKKSIFTSALYLFPPDLLYHAICASTMCITSNAEIMGDLTNIL